MRIAICDDEEKDLQALSEAVRKFDTNGLLEVCMFSSAADLYESRLQTPFDIAIMDIEMRSPNGYEIAQLLIAENPAPLIIFLTNSMAYTLRGYGVAFRYLTKPIQQNQLEKALSAAVAEVAAKQFTFSADSASHVIRMDDIYYFEVFNHHSILHTVDQAFTFRATLKDVLAELPVGYFGAPHQSYIINFRHVKTSLSKEVHLTNGAVIPVSRRKQQDFDNQLRAFLRR